MGVGNAHAPFLPVGVGNAHAPFLPVGCWECTCTISACGVLGMHMHHFCPEEVQHASRNADSACPFLPSRQYKKGRAESAFRDACHTSSDFCLSCGVLEMHMHHFCLWGVAASILALQCNNCIGIFLGVVFGAV